MREVGLGCDVDDGRVHDSSLLVGPFAIGTELGVMPPPEALPVYPRLREDVNDVGIHAAGQTVIPIGEFFCPLCTLLDCATFGNSGLHEACPAVCEDDAVKIVSFCTLSDDFFPGFLISHRHLRRSFFEGTSELGPILLLHQLLRPDFGWHSTFSYLLKNERFSQPSGVKSTQ